ncbi:MAG: biopolymer transporter ExbD, partial [Siculibacillus sp.]|nr:biopolymer transporter ExbD [Siculibacillus sp.]
VTPLVDVMLVLLVVFMITAPMLAAGIEVKLPHADAARPLAPREPIVVTVTPDGVVAVGQEPVAREALVAQVRDRLAADPDRVVQVRGDRDAAYGEIVAVIDLLAGGGISRIALVSRPRGPASASTTAAPVRLTTATAAAVVTEIDR